MYIEKGTVSEEMQQQVNLARHEGAAFAQVLEALASIDQGAQQRVLRWASERFRPPTGARVDAESRRRVEAIVDEVHAEHGMPT